eukprot:UN04281
MSTYTIICASIWIVFHCSSRLCIAGRKYIFAGEFSGSELFFVDLIGLMRDVRIVTRKYTKETNTVEWETDQDKIFNYMCFNKEVSFITYALAISIVFNLWFWIFFIPLILPLFLLQYTDRPGWFTGVFSSVILLILGTIGTT